MENKTPGKDLTLDDLKEKIPLAAKQNEQHKTVFDVSGVPIGGTLIPVFAGPNTVENREMILQTAAAVKESGGHFLRGGAYKPLTFPYRGQKYFELRDVGLKYLDDAKKEVADILQIGTRNMQNYPLLEAAGNSGKPIMLKRHFGCSLRDWLGAAEYILHTGNERLILCERGVSVPHTHSATSRFLLDLQVVPAAQEVTHLPIITDPSHATFNRAWVPSMSLASIASGADGIMLEVHPDPENAAVDPLQAIGFERFNVVMNQMEKVANSVGRTLNQT